MSDPIEPDDDPVLKLGNTRDLVVLVYSRMTAFMTELREIRVEQGDHGRRIAALETDRAVRSAGRAGNVSRRQLFGAIVVAIGTFGAFVLAAVNLLHK
jgi:hypothetical protein